MSERTETQLGEIVRFADELPVAIWVGSVPSGECVYVNQAFRTILGIDPPEGAARGNYVGPYSVHTLTGAPYPEKQMPYERALAARALVEIDDMFIQRHDGGRTYLRVYARPLFDEGGEMTHVVEAFTDISREALSNEKQRVQEAQLRRAQRMEALGSLAGGIAHDFNNLLTAIKMIVGQLGLVRNSDSRVATGLAQIDDVAESAARLTRALLDFARPGMSLKRRVSLRELATKAALLAASGLDPRITIEGPLGDEDLHVEGDPTQLEQLLLNLIWNARDAIATAGRVTLRLRRRTVSADELGALAPGQYAQLEVEDTGGGIAPEVRERIFEPYFTTKSSGAIKGTGLGLAMVFGIVESHDGHVDVTCTGASGTTMRVLLPLVD
jgi:two-component system cell cycle sensor histidine kinase/response regulator CckA